MYKKSLLWNKKFLFLSLCGCIAILSLSVMEPGPGQVPEELWRKLEETLNKEIKKGGKSFEALALDSIYFPKEIYKKIRYFLYPALLKLTYDFTIERQDSIVKDLLEEINKILPQGESERNLISIEFNKIVNSLKSLKNCISLGRDVSQEEIQVMNCSLNSFLEKVFSNSQQPHYWLVKPLLLPFYQYWSFCNLVKAIQENDKDLASKFINNAAADVNTLFGKEKETILMLFTKEFINSKKEEKLEWIWFLISHNANPHTKNKQGYTPYLLARSYENVKLLNLFSQDKYQPQNNGAGASQLLDTTASNMLSRMYWSQS